MFGVLVDALRDVAGRADLDSEITVTTVGSTIDRDGCKQCYKLVCCMDEKCSEIPSTIPMEGVYKLRDVLSLRGTDERERALVICTLNLLGGLSGLRDGARFCVGALNERCSRLAVTLVERFGSPVVLLGYNDAYLGEFSKFTGDLYVVDDSLAGTIINGIPILSHEDGEEVLRKAKLIVVSPLYVISDYFWEMLRKVGKDKVVLYGAPNIVVGKVLGMTIYCPYARRL